MMLPTVLRTAALACLGAAGLVAAPEDRQARIVNRSSHTWELRLSDQGHGTLQVKVKSKGGKVTEWECEPGQPGAIKLRPLAEVTLSFLESKGMRSRPATLGELGALEEERAGLYLQEGPTGLVLAATQDRDRLNKRLRQKGNRLEIEDPRTGTGCTIL